MVTTASADVPLKGLLPLVEAIAKVRTERAVELVVIGSARAGRAGGRARSSGTAWQDAVRFTGRVSDDELVHHLRSAELAVVPSLFEGFSLPLVEAMACATPVVATTGGALPEVAGPDGETRAARPAGRRRRRWPRRSAGPWTTPTLRARLGAAGRARVVERFTWRAAAARTVEVYRRAIAIAAPHRTWTGDAC